MTTRTICIFGILLLGVFALIWFFRIPDVTDRQISKTSEALERGRYLISAAGCISCHEGEEGTDSLSGGKPLESEFGVFYVPNITPHVVSGIGSWSARDFLLAIKHGRSPEGGYYYPAFPYRSYAGMTDDDVLDIAAYLLSLTPVDSNVPPHDIPAWLRRWLMVGWNVIANLLSPDLENYTDPVLARGAYLARNLGHCGECHTPRDRLGIPDMTREFSGADMSSGHVEAINSEALSEWSKEDFAFFLFLGMKPDGEYVGGEMESVIEHNTSQLKEEDRQALSAFFKRELL